MRPIKFRAWDERKKEWLSYFAVSNTGLIQALDDKGNDWSARDGQNVSLMQYTGLTDKNGKEIYEGDVVEWDDNSDGRWRRRCVVGWTPAHYTLKGYYYDVKKPEEKTPIDFRFGAFIYEEDGELEVIGNIYESPDLIKEMGV